MVLLIDNLASGNKTLDKLINVLYVSCVSETFRYFVISVMCSFHLNYYIGFFLNFVNDKIYFNNMGVLFFGPKRVHGAYWKYNPL